MAGVGGGGDSFLFFVNFLVLLVSLPPPMAPTLPPAALTSPSPWPLPAGGGRGGDSPPFFDDFLDLLASLPPPIAPTLSPTEPTSRSRWATAGGGEAEAGGAEAGDSTRNLSFSASGDCRAADPSFAVFFVVVDWLLPPPWLPPFSRTLAPGVCPAVPTVATATPPPLPPPLPPSCFLDSATNELLVVLLLREVRCGKGAVSGPGVAGGAAVTLLRAPLPPPIFQADDNDPDTCPAGGDVLFLEFLWRWKVLPSFWRSTALAVACAAGAVAAAAATVLLGAVARTVFVAEPVGQRVRRTVRGTARGAVREKSRIAAGEGVDAEVRATIDGAADPAELLRVFALVVEFVVEVLLLLSQLRCPPSERPPSRDGEGRRTPPRILDGGTLRALRKVSFRGRKRGEGKGG